MHGYEKHTTGGQILQAGSAPAGSACAAETMLYSYS